MIKFSALCLLLTVFCSLVAANIHNMNSFCRTHCAVKGKVASDVPVDYEHFPGVGYYKLYENGAMSYWKAMATCEADGAHLAIINSPREEKILISMFAESSTEKNAAYLGFNDIEEEGKYVTIYDEPLQYAGYYTWSKGEPSTGERNEDCGSIHRNGGLNDLYCNEHGPWPFFCEIEL